MSALEVFESWLPRWEDYWRDQELRLSRLLDHDIQKADNPAARIADRRIYALECQVATLAQAFSEHDETIAAVAETLSLLAQRLITLEARP